MKTTTNFETFNFQWKVFTDGYEWRGDQLWDKGKHTRFYQPLREHTALFMEFAQIKPTKAGILKFVHQYGTLRLPPAPARGSFSLPRRQTNDTLKDWREAIGTLRAVLWKWQQIANLFPSEPLQTFGLMLSSNRRPPDSRWIEHPTFGDITEFWLILNRLLQSHPTHVRILPTVNGDWQLVFEPKDLLGAIWLQLAQAVAGNYSIKICRGCGKPFQVGGGNRRADATTCNDTCRQRANRKAKEGHNGNQTR